MSSIENTLTLPKVQEALRVCFTASNAFNKTLNIVDLGLVERIELAPDPDAPGSGIPGVPPRQSLSLHLLRPTADEDANALLLAQVRNRLSGLPQLLRINVAWSEGTSWSEARISPNLRLRLKPAFPILNNRKQE